MKEVDQEVQVASEDLVDFQPDVTHQVVTENKRKKHLFEKLFLEGRPPLNVGVTSGGDFFGGSQIALSDVLGDKNFTVTALSLREFHRLPDVQWMDSYTEPENATVNRMWKDRRPMQSVALAAGAWGAFWLSVYSSLRGKARTAEPVRPAA